MKHIFFWVIIFTQLLFIQKSISQNVGIGTSNPSPSAQLEVSSTNKGFLPPRMTTAQRNTITNPADGLQIFNTTTNCLEIYISGYWQNIYCSIYTSVNDIDGNEYPTVVICNKLFSKNNLSVSRYRNGDIIPNVTDSAAWNNLTTGAWCWYKNDSATYAATYGKLYNWYAVADPRGLAPEGWHVTSDADWNKLIKCLDPIADTAAASSSQSLLAGGTLKFSGTDFWSSPNTGATDSVSFSALPGGYRGNNSIFSNASLYGYWWTSSAKDALTSYYRVLFYNNTRINRIAFNKKYGYSVRIMKD
jgi:hypothetical protein